MSEVVGRGPEVDRAEELYRAITLSDWWLADPERPRPRSAAFNWPCFSVNIASHTTQQKAVEHLHTVLKCPQGGIVSFNCGTAKDLGFDPRHEPEEGNEAHANVYSDGRSNERKRRAKRLAEDSCSIILEPSF